MKFTILLPKNYVESDSLISSRWCWDSFTYCGLWVWQFFIVLSCMISVSVNFSTFLVIGKTSAVTYQVLGHLKTCLVLAFGYILLKNPFSWRNVCGILIAVCGMVSYSYACVSESQQKAEEIPIISTQVWLFSLHSILCMIALIDFDWFQVLCVSSLYRCWNWWHVSSQESN